MTSYFLRYRSLIVYALLFPVLIFILKWLQWKFVILSGSFGIYSGLIAVIFTLFGAWLATRLTGNVKPEVVTAAPVPVPDHSEGNTRELEKLGLSNREKEVFRLLLKGDSNAEIATALFLSLSTVKTHVSNILLKMDVPSRTKAIEKVKRLNITV